MPHHVAAAVAKSLEKLPADRFASAREFGEALRNTSFTVAGGVAGIAAAVPQSRHWRAIALAASAVAVIAMAAAAWTAGRPEPAGRLGTTPWHSTARRRSPTSVPMSPAASR